MNVKVCGITQMKQLQQMEAMNVDFVGLIFYKESPRCMKDKIMPEELSGADFEFRKVGVFVDPEMIDVLDAIDEFGLDMVQLHGSESPEMCNDLSEEVEVIKAFRIPDDPDTDIDQLVMPYDDACDYYLFDTGGLKESFGGTGKSFNWDLLSKAKIEKPFFLSGGIGPEDVNKLRSFTHPDLFAIDINSRFENEPGIKDIPTVLKFITALK